jgi:hypothetical protein
MVKADDLGETVPASAGTVSSSYSFGLGSITPLNVVLPKPTDGPIAPA